MKAWHERVCLECYTKHGRTRTLYVYRDAGPCVVCKVQLAKVESVAVMVKP